MKSTILTASFQALLGASFEAPCIFKAVSIARAKKLAKAIYKGFGKVGHMTLCEVAGDKRGVVMADPALDVAFMIRKLEHSASEETIGKVWQTQNSSMVRSVIHKLLCMEINRLEAAQATRKLARSNKAAKIVLQEIPPPPSFASWDGMACDEVFPGRFRAVRNTQHPAPELFNVTFTRDRTSDQHVLSASWGEGELIVWKDTNFTDIAAPFDWELVVNASCLEESSDPHFCPVYRLLQAGVATFKRKN